jgi:REP element-mobilizing transposase RayT
MNRAISRRDLFVEDKDRERFLALLGEISRHWKVEIFAYCLMDNHYHLLLQTPNAGLSRAMRHLDGIYTQRFNRAHHRDGPIFRGRYKAILIDAEEHFLSVVRYVHQNPVASGIVTDVDRYRWSSHRAYLDKRFCFPWLNTHPVLTRFRGLREYREFMHAKMEEEVKAFYRGSYQKPILGDSGFVQWVREKLGDRVKVEQDKPESRRVFGLEIGEVVRATAKVYGKAVEELRRKRRGEENEARSMAMYLSRVLGGHEHSEIGKVLGLEKTSSVSSACLRMKQRVESDRRMGRRARQIEQLLLKSQERI